MPPTYLPPHLATPEFTTCTAADREAFTAAMFRSFHQEPCDEETAVLGSAWDADRYFGFKVDDRWIATAGSFARTMTVPGGSTPVSAFTAVTVASAYRRRGLLTQMMRHELNTAYAERGEPIAILWASEAPIYGRFGFGPAVTSTRINAETGAVQFLPHADFGDGSVDEVTQGAFLAAASTVRAGLLADRPGALDRDDGWWTWTTFDPPGRRKGATSYRWILHFDKSGTADGYAYFRVKSHFGSSGPDGEVQIDELDAATPQAYASLWRYLTHIDLTRSFRLRNARADESLRHLITNARALQTSVSDGIYLRVIDVPTALAARRYRADVDVVIEVTDDQLPDNNGKFHLVGRRDSAKVTRTRRKPDASMGILELGTIYLGGVPLVDLHRAGRVVEHRHGAVEAVSAAFGWPRAPWCSDNF